MARYRKAKSQGAYIDRLRTMYPFRIIAHGGYEDEIRNGGYRVYSVSAILDECKNNETTGWHNIDAFCIELADLLK